MKLLEARLRASPAQAWRDQHVIHHHRLPTGDQLARPPGVHTEARGPRDNELGGPVTGIRAWGSRSDSGRLRARLDMDALARLGLHLTLAALPLLAISAHVFGLVAMHLTAGLVVIPLVLVVVALALFDPRQEERVIAHGMHWGVVATVVYDAVRLDTAYLLGLWGDFIPTVGTWIMGVSPQHRAGGAVVGYLWRYLGDGGGIGVTFFVLAAATGLCRRSTSVIVAASVGFAVFPVWAGLIATVALAPQGQALMFPLTTTTITLSLIGHLVFGLMLGLGAARHRSRDLTGHWPAALTINSAVLAELPVLGGLFALQRSGRGDQAPAPQPPPWPVHRARAAGTRQLPPRSPSGTSGGWPDMTAGPARLAIGRDETGYCEHRRQVPSTGSMPTPAPVSPPGGFSAVPSTHLSAHGTRPTEAMPLNMVLVTGSAKASTANGEGANAKYTCSGSGGRLTDQYPMCPQGSQLQRVFDFPSCWNGRELDSEDHTSHIRFPDQDGECAADETPVPALRISVTTRTPPKGARSRSTASPTSSTTRSPTTR